MRMRKPKRLHVVQYNKQVCTYLIISSIPHVSGKVFLKGDQHTLSALENDNGLINLSTINSFRKGALILDQGSSGKMESPSFPTGLLNITLKSTVAESNIMVVSQFPASPLS